MRVLLIVLVILSSFSGWMDRSALGAELRLDGNELLEYCSLLEANTPKTTLEAGHTGYCMGYISAFTYAINFYEGLIDYLGNKRTICLPKEATFGQYQKVVIKYLQDHPERLHDSQGILTINALKEAFPCK